MNATLYDETRALSPQVKALFEVVRAQALEYARAFELVEAKAREIDRLQSGLKNLSDSFRIELDEQFKETSTKIEDYFEKIDNIYEDALRRVELLKDLEFTINVAEDMALRLKELESNIAPKVERFEQLYAELNAYRQEQIERGSERLEGILKGIAGSVYQEMKTDVAEEGKRIENKIDLKQKFIEGRMINMENSFWEVRQDFVESSRRMGERVDKLRAAISGINGAMQDLSGEVKNRVMAVHNEVEKKFAHIDIAIRELNKGEYLFGTQKYGANGKQENTTYSNSLESKINQLEAKFNSLKNAKSGDGRAISASYKILIVLSLLLGSSAVIISLAL